MRRVRSRRQNKSDCARTSGQIIRYYAGVSVYQLRGGGGGGGWMCEATVQHPACESELLKERSATDTPAVHFIDHPDDRPLFRVSRDQLPASSRKPRESLFASIVNRFAWMEVSLLESHRSRRKGFPIRSVSSLLFYPKFSPHFRS